MGGSSISLFSARGTYQEAGGEASESKRSSVQISKAQTALQEIEAKGSLSLSVQQKNQAIDKPWLAPVLSWFTSSTPPLAQTASSIQAKSVLLDRLFEKMLSLLSTLEIPNKPSLFLVYAHNNTDYGQAKADIAKYLIKKLSQLRVKLYSDQTPMAQPYSGLIENLRKDAQLDNILTSQLCLLPTQLRSDVHPVDKVMVCCSEVLAQYLAWSAYPDFYQQLQQAYLIDARQRSDVHIREVVNTFSQKTGFHHVLTEIAFLHIRAEELGDQHGIIPVAFTPKSVQRCLGHFMDQTTVRIEDIPRIEQQAQAGQVVYAQQSRHAVMLKLIERLFVTSDEAKAALDEFWQEYSRFMDRLNTQSSVPTALEFFDRVETICNKVQAALNQQPRHLSSSDLRQVLYQHYYHSNLSIQRVSGQTVSLRDCYINLAIVESHAQLEKEKEALEKQAAAFIRLPSSEQLQETNYSKLIALENLFDAQPLRDGSIGFPKRLLIQGRAGIGKTTFCKKLVYDYQHRAPWSHRFACVLWIPLRQLKTIQLYSLKKLLSEHYFASQTDSEELIKTFEHNKNQTLFILDGLDEVVGELDDSHPLSRFLKELLSQQHVVITSRPAGVDTHLLGQLDLTLETVGFTPDNVQTYIRTFVPEVNQAAIQQFIRQTPFIQGLVNIPIQLDALCYSWGRLPQGQGITMSALYEVMVDKLWRKDCVRLEKKEEGQSLGSEVIANLTQADLKEFMAAEIYYLGYLAFKGLAAEKIEFDREELSQRRNEMNESAAIERQLLLSFTTNLKKTSYLHTADTHLPEAERRYHFLHLTFQEFFAAQFLAKHLQAYSALAHRGLGLMLDREKLHTYIATHKYNPRYEIVWWMVAGLLKGQALAHFFTLLEEAPRDLIGLRHQQVIMGCLNEARPHLKANMVDRLEAELVQWLRFETTSENCKISMLGRHMAFPERLLLTFLNQPEGRRNIIWALAIRPTLSDAAISSSIILLQHENKEFRGWATQILSRQETLSENTISSLIALLSHENEAIRRQPAGMLISQKMLSENTISSLIALLQHENQDVRGWAATILIMQERLSENTVSSLIALLPHENDAVRDRAAGILSEQKTLSENMISSLIDLLQHENEVLRGWAAEILSR